MNMCFLNAWRSEKAKCCKTHRELVFFKVKVLSIRLALLHVKSQNKTMPCSEPFSVKFEKCQHQMEHYFMIKYWRTYLPHVAALHVAALHVLRALSSLWHSVCAPRTLPAAVLWAPRFVSPAPWCVHQSDGQFLEAPPHLAFGPPSASSQGVKFVKWGEHVKNKFRTSLDIWRNGMITEEREL